MAEKQTFEEYLDENLTKEDRHSCRPEIIDKLCFWLKKNKNIDLFKDIIRQKSAISLFAEEVDNADFLKDEPKDVREDCLFCLAQYHEYTAYLNKTPPAKVVYRTPPAYQTFSEYLNNLFINNITRHICRTEVYSKISAYILKNEHMNLVTDVRNADTVRSWLEKYSNDKAFMSDRPDLREDCLKCLQTYVEYLDYFFPKTSLWGDDEPEYCDDKTPQKRLIDL